MASPRAVRCVLFAAALFATRLRSPLVSASPSAQPWEGWLENFGHDSYRYPAWISSQRQQCSCDIAETSGERAVSCLEGPGRDLVDWENAAELTWCVALQFSLSHMPEFDLDYLPGSVSVDGESMLDDNIAFTLMAWNASHLTPKPPISVALPYLLPYANYHEARANWRPLFFAKYFKLASAPTSTTSRAVLEALIGGGPGTNLMNWTRHTWPDFAGKSASNSYDLGPFSSSTCPPVVAPFDFAAYGYGSCTAWSTFVSSALKAVGVPARQVGSPCWNTGEFAGLATDNPNVSACWSGGPPTGPFGGKYLNNHNWVEYWDNEIGDWQFVESSGTVGQDTWFCGNFTQKGRCDCASNAGKAGQDHDIFAATWSAPTSAATTVDGGTVVNVAELRLSSGEAFSPLVWSPRLKSPRGKALKNVGLRAVNRTAFYRCQQSNIVM